MTGSRAMRRPPLQYPEFALHGFLRAAVRNCPERTFLRFEDEALTFRELDSWGTAFANALRSSGVVVGDRVMLAMANRSECLMVEHGLSQLGAATVLVNPSWKAYELRRALELTRPVAVVADAAVATELDGIEDRFQGIRVCVDDPPPGGWRSFWELVHSSSGRRPPDLDVDLSKLEAVLLFSSGTTGLPKAVRHSHQSITTAITQRVAAYGITDADRLQYFMALCTTYGVICSLAAIAARASLRLFRRFDAATVLDNIEREGITLAFGAAPVAVALRDVPDLERYDLSSLRWMMWGATPVLPEVAAEVTRRTGVRWMQAYGTTEVGIASNLATEPDRLRLDTPGFALSDVELQTVDPATLEVLPQGEAGELVVRSPGLMMGYLPEEENADVFLPDGWFRTGDLASIDRHGWVHLTDRVKELIKVSAFQVAPAELEGLISSIPGVVDCAVYGIPDPRRGERPKAAVVLTPSGSPDEASIMAFVAERVAAYKQLAGVIVVDSIPRNTGGKILRWALRELDEKQTGQTGASKGSVA